MQRLAGSPVQDITFGTALKITLDNYYDLLKTQVGGLKTDEFLQLKLVADTIDLSLDKKASEGGYVWNSYYNLLGRSDRGIQPIPVAGEIQVGLEDLASIYAKFLRKLRTYVIVKVLSPSDQLKIADLDKTLESLKDDVTNLYINDRQKWKKIADAMGYDVGDMNAYIQWSSQYGHIRDIQSLTNQIRSKTFEKNTILNTTYPTPEDREVVDAEFDLENPLMRLRFPIWPDLTYPDGDKFSPTYLALLPLGSTALFDDRLTTTWDKTLTAIKGAGAGSFTATLDKSTSSSNSITTDWSGSASGSYGFIRANVSASQHVAIQEEFDRGQTISVSALSAQRININFPSWFRPTLFSHKRVLENPSEFLEFLGEKGSLLYYPTALIVVRGFSVVFESSQNWTYDYVKQFSASGGGGFNAFGVSFGSSASYSSTVKEHEVDKSGTKLTIADDRDTIRFVGYALKKSDVLKPAIEKGVREKQHWGTANDNHHDSKKKDKKAG
ncbi:hypothetical protein PQQ77_15145 [Paraburkholderia strydomiana]|uniref:hypothetical protein n=1 Tax=Paraburkholderia strydomiana TaxID=1245417 RepID=UPI0038BDF5D5